MNRYIILLLILIIAGCDWIFSKNPVGPKKLDLSVYTQVLLPKEKNADKTPSVLQTKDNPFPDKKI